MTTVSPFSLARFEYEPVPLFYLPKKFKVLQDFKPTYVVGSRGTGKTTLLNALNWEQQLTNLELEQQLGGSFFGRKYVGLYLRAPRFQCDKFEAWLSSQPESIYGTLFSTYFDLAWIEVLANALADLLARGALSASTAKEYETTGSIFNRFPELLADSPKSHDYSFKKFSDIIRRRREELENLAIWATAPDRDALSNRFPLRHYGELGRTVGVSFAEFCDQIHSRRSNWSTRPQKANGISKCA